MPTQQSFNQGSYNGSRQSKSSKWVCPNDETINTGEYCIICGCARPTEESPVSPPKSPPKPPQHPKSDDAGAPPKSPKKNHRSLVSVLCIIAIVGLSLFRFVSNSLYGYYISESGHYSVSIEHDGICYWYQDGLRFDGTYEKNESSLQLLINGTDFYRPTTFLAVIEKSGLRIAGGTVDSELFTKASKSEEIRKLDERPSSVETEVLYTDSSIDKSGVESETQCVDPNGIKRVVAGNYHAVAIRNDGTVFATGENSDGQCNLDNWTGIVDVALCGFSTFGLREDQTVCCAGSQHDRFYAESNKWKNIAKITGRGRTIAGLRLDGTVVTNDIDDIDVTHWTNIVDISAGNGYLVGLKSDGTAVAAGTNKYGQCDVGNWKDLISISAGDYHTVGLKKDGTVVAVGLNDDGQCNVRAWSNIVAVNTGLFYTVGITKDGYAIATGPNYICGHIGGESSVVDFSAGPWHVLFLHKDGTVSAYGGGDIYGSTSGWRNIKQIAAGGDYSVGVTEDNSIIACAYSDSTKDNIFDWLPEQPEQVAEETPVPTETTIVTQPTTPEGYYRNIDGDWTEKIKIGDINAWLFVFNSPLVDCKEMTVTIDVEMNAGTSCKDWVLWGRKNGQMQKLGEIYLADGAGLASKTFFFHPAISVDAVVATPTIPGGYSWTLGMAVTDVWLEK